MLPSVAVICPLYSRPALASFLEEVQDECRTELLCYRTLDEILPLFNSVESTFDGLLFSGWLPYSVVIAAKGVIQKPCSFFSISEGDFYQAMFDLSVRYPRVPYSRVMVDDPQLDFDIRSRFQPDNACIVTSFYLLEYTMTLLSDSRTGQTAPEELYTAALQAYRDAFFGGRVDAIVTRLPNLIPVLEREGIPCMAMSPSKHTMTERMERLIYAIGNNNYSGMLSVCGLLKPREGADGSALQELRRTADRFNQAHAANLYLSTEEDAVRITTSNVHFKRIQDKKEGCLLSDYLLLHTDVPFSLGWGLGNDVMKARANAGTALKLAKHTSGSNTYLVTESDMVVGPMKAQGQLSFSAVRDEALLVDSARYDTSPVNLQRLRALIKQRGDRVFTSEELAQALSLSPRSSRRILLKLCERGGAVLLDNEVTGLKGRPCLRYKVLV